MSRKRFLFVCVGNAIRSQIAEALFRHYNRDDALMAESAGIRAASQIFPETITAMKKRGIDLSGKRPRQLSAGMAKKADVIYALDQEAVPLLPPEKTVAFLLTDPHHHPDALPEVIRRIDRLVQDILRSNEAKKRNSYK